MFQQLEVWLLGLAGKLPLEIFALVASFVEETIPPIPSPAVMMITGSVAKMQDYAWPSLIILVVLASIGKTIGGLVVYFVVDKIEDVVSGRWAKFFGVSHQSIEAFGARFGKGWRDYVFLIILRSLPIVPSSVISVGCGVIKVRMKLFLPATFFGSLIRDSIYIYIGFAGVELFKSFVAKTTTMESVVQVSVLVVAILLLGWAYYRRSIKNKA